MLGFRVQGLRLSFYGLGCRFSGLDFTGLRFITIGFRV